MKRLLVQDFLRQAKGKRIIDVRSPGEFQKGHINGAVNIPIFTNKERVEVGTVYKQKSREEAILLGLDIVGPKLRSIADEGKRIALDNELFIYCWRGGMRSEKMAWLFDLNGIQSKVLEGGYKNYRAHGRALINRVKEFIIIQGPTGSGKTEILGALKNLGEQTIDLEGLANHKGSAFGGLGQQRQPGTQQFQNEISSIIEGFDLEKPIWIESESITIGRVYLPEELWSKMNQAKIISITVPRTQRIDNILAQYGNFSKDELIEKVEQLSQKLGGLAVKEITNNIESGSIHNAVDRLLTYYDKSYAFSAKVHKLSNPMEVEFKNISAHENAEILLEKSKMIHA